MIEKLISIQDYIDNRGIYYFEGYTTARRKGKGHKLFSPCTYEISVWTDYASGRSVNLKLEDILEKYKEDEKAYITFLVDDGKSTTTVQLRSVRLIVLK